MSSSDSVREVWVVGASRGIGRTLAETLDAELDRPLRRISRSEAGNILDAEFTAELLERHGAPWAWIHTPGDFFERPLLETDDAQWEQLLLSNLWSFVRPARQILPAMAAAGGGRVITFGAAGLALGTAKLRGSAYFAVKAALLSATKTLALEYGTSGLCINMISPGIVLHPTSHRESQERLAPRVPLGRIGTPQDLLGVVRMLLGDGGAYLTGDEITVDGGLSLGFGHA